MRPFACAPPALALFPLTPPSLSFPAYPTLPLFPCLPQARQAAEGPRREGAQVIALQIEGPAGATRGGPSQPSYGPHVKARACVYAHPCVLGTHCPHPSLPHSTGTHSLSDTHTHTDQLVPHMHTRALCVSEAPGGAGKTGKSMRKHCRPSAPRAHMCVCACECVSASVCVCVCVCVSACG